MRRLVRENSHLLLLALAKVAIHIPAMTRYGYFRDELYYLASTEHLAWGYVEHPPLSIVILAGVRGLLGDSLVALRLLPVLSGALLVFLTGRIARELGGGRFAQTLAALGVIASPTYMALHHYYSMNCWELLSWTVVVLLLLRMLKASVGPNTSTRGWLLLGVALGLALLNKISVLWLGAGIGVGLLLTPDRALLKTRGPYLAAACALLLMLPHVLWQVRHGWPTLEFVRNATQQKMVAVSPSAFLTGQLLEMNPANALLWLPGLWWCLFAPAGRRWQLLGWIYATVLAILLLSRTSRSYYLTPAYPMLLATGAIAWERWLASTRVRWWRYVLAGNLVFTTAVLAPFGMPVLSVEHYLRYARALGIAPSTEEHLALAELPQHYADMHGWSELVDAVAAVYATLTPAEQQRVTIFGQNYGEAGAIDVLGRQRGLPHAISAHNSYWLWGPGDRDGSVVIVIGGDAEDGQRLFESFTQAGTAVCHYCMPYENNLPIYVGRGLRGDIRQLWPGFKSYI